MNIIENDHPGKFTGKEVEIYISTKHLVQRSIINIKRQEANEQLNNFFDSNCKRG